MMKSVARLVKHPVTCSARRVCPIHEKHNDDLCCVSCPDFQTCLKVCREAERWDIHLEKCVYAGECESVLRRIRWKVGTVFRMLRRLHDV